MVFREYNIVQDNKFNNPKTTSIMKTYAHYCITSTTDLVRKNMEPLINDTDRELFVDYEDFVFGCSIRYLGIKSRFPSAEFVDTGNGVCIFIEGFLVYESHIVLVEPELIEIPDEDDEDAWENLKRKPDEWSGKWD